MTPQDPRSAAARDTLRAERIKVSQTIEVLKAVRDALKKAELGKRYPTQIEELAIWATNVAVRCDAVNQAGSVLLQLNDVHLANLPARRRWEFRD